MKLVDKIQEARSNKLSDYSIIYTPTAEVIEKIADDYAIEFSEWFINNGVEFYDNTSKGNVYKYISDLKVYTIKELLEIFKKEKGL